MALTQYIVPFLRVHLNHPIGVAVDPRGALYVACAGQGSSVIALEREGGAPTVLPIPMKNPAHGIAVDGFGNVYVRGFGDKSVTMWSARGDLATLPVDRIKLFNALAAGVNGEVYAAGVFNKPKIEGVAQLWPTSPMQTLLPLTRVNQIKGAATDRRGYLYLSCRLDKQREEVVIRLDPRSGDLTVLPLTGLRYCMNRGIAVDSSDNVYVSEPSSNQVIKLAAESGAQTILPFTGLYDPVGLAVDADGNVFVADKSNHRIVVLAP